MVMCWAPDCRHYNVRERCKFFTFPKDTRTRNKWIRLLRRKDKPGPGAVICSCHFRDADRNNCPELFAHNEAKRSLFLISSPEQRKRKRNPTTKGSPDVRKSSITTSSTLIQLEHIHPSTSKELNPKVNYPSNKQFNNMGPSATKESNPNLSEDHPVCIPEKVDFSNIPPREKIRAKACGREDLEDKVKLYGTNGVCGGLQFENKMFVNDLKNRLQPHAIPTVFPTSISNIADDHSYAAVSKAPDYIIKEELMDDPLDIKEEVVTESEGLIEEGFNIKNEVVSESEEMINESIDIKDEVLTDSEEELVNEPLDIKDEVVSESEEVPIEDSLDIEDEILSGSEDTLSNLSIPCTSEDTLEFEKQSLSQEVISIIKDLRSMEEIETIRRFMVSFNTVLCALRNTKENNQG